MPYTTPIFTLDISGILCLIAYISLFISILQLLLIVFIYIRYILAVGDIYDNILIKILLPMTHSWTSVFVPEIIPVINVFTILIWGFIIPTFKTIRNWSKKQRILNTLRKL